MRGFGEGREEAGLGERSEKESQCGSRLSAVRGPPVLTTRSLPPTSRLRRSKHASERSNRERAFGDLATSLTRGKSDASPKKEQI